MKTHLLLAFIFAVVLAFFLPTRLVQADGIIIPPPCGPRRCPPPPCLDFPCPPPRPMAQFVIKYHQVEVTIADQLATTKVDQVFFNPNEDALEGTYVFPIPADAVVSGFKLWMDGQAVEGKLLSAEEARQIYEETVRTMRDPALLEYMGRGAFQARVFPIPPSGERRIQIEYSQALKAENGLSAIYSPTHPITLTRDGQMHASVNYSAKQVLPDADFMLYFSTGNQTGLHILSYRDPNDPQDADGYFLMLLAPGAVADQKPLPKDVLLVLDRSGSMEGVKFRQAQDALRYILKKLNPEDRFYLETFSSSVETFASGLRSAAEAPQASAWVDRLQSAGSTDINRALLEAVSIAEPRRPTYLIFLTDGLPTLGELDTPKILDNIIRSAPQSLRLFTFGVGYDVDTFLLDSLSGDHHGTSTYVQPKESLDEILSGFYERISQPVLTDLGLDFGSLGVYDLYPQPLPDLFSGGQVLLAGRYRGGGKTSLTLKGNVGTQAVQQTFADLDFSQDSRSADPSLAAVARIWASRKIGYLLNQIRLDGANPEIIDQIVRLSTRFGIITPYTSYLVTEPNPLGAESQKRIAQDAYQQAQAAPEAASGQKAVERAAEEGQLQSANAAPQLAQTAGNPIRTVGPRTFVLIEGVWTDTTFDPQKMSLIDLPFLSAAYQKLADSRPDLASALALGNKIILVADGKAYQVKMSEAAETPLPQAMDTTAAPTLGLTLTPVPQTPTTSQPAQSTPDSPACPNLALLVGIGIVVAILKKK